MAGGSHSPAKNASASPPATLSRGSRKGAAAGRDQSRGACARVRETDDRACEGMPTYRNVPGVAPEPSGTAREPYRTSLTTPLLHARTIRHSPGKNHYGNHLGGGSRRTSRRAGCLEAAPRSGRLKRADWEHDPPWSIWAARRSSLGPNQSLGDRRPRGVLHYRPRRLASSRSIGVCKRRITRPQRPMDGIPTTTTNDTAIRTSSNIWCCPHQMLPNTAKLKATAGPGWHRRSRRFRWRRYYPPNQPAEGLTV